MGTSCINQQVFFSLNLLVDGWKYERYSIHYTYNIGWLDFASSVESSGNVFVVFFGHRDKKQKNHIPDISQICFVGVVLGSDSSLTSAATPGHSYKSPGLFQANTLDPPSQKKCMADVPWFSYLHLLCTLWWFNITIQHFPFTNDFPIKTSIDDFA